MIKSTNPISNKIVGCRDSNTLPYPCYLRYTYSDYDYIVLAIEPSGMSFKAIIVKVLDKPGYDTDICEGVIDDTFSMGDFGTPEGFNFYNEAVTTKNSAVYE